MPKTLIFDIETSPNVAHVWQFYNTNVGGNQILEDGHVLSYAAKWLDSKPIMYEENRTGDDKDIIVSLLGLIEEADIVVAHNGKKFDMGWIKAKAAIHGLFPPSPVKVVDTYISAKREFYFPSYRLEYLARVFGCNLKSSHKQFPGHELWVECLKGTSAAWKEMKKYNIQDVKILEELYLKMLPWMSQHPNMGVLIEADEPRCTKCGSENLHKRGFQTTNVSKFQRYQCQDCGGWSRSRYNILDKTKAKELLTNAV